MKNGDKPIAILQSKEGIWKEHEAEYILNSGGLLGLTKREYFAGLAMQGMLAHPHSIAGAVPVDAVYLADKLLAELEKPQP